MAQVSPLAVTRGSATGPWRTCAAAICAVGQARRAVDRAGADRVRIPATGRGGAGSSGLREAGRDREGGVGELQWVSTVAPAANLGGRVVTDCGPAKPAARPLFEIGSATAIESRLVPAPSASEARRMSSVICLDAGSNWARSHVWGRLT